MALSPAAIADLLDGRADDDEVAAAAYELFGRSVFPFAGVFLDPEVSSQQPLADALRSEELPGSLWGWVPAFCCAVDDVGSPLGDQVSSSLRSLLIAVSPGGDGLGPADPPDLDDPATDLRTLIEYLSTPMRCGMFISVSVLERVGRELEVPRGFGPRARVLRQLLLGAARYDKQPAVLGSLLAVAAAHDAALATYTEPAAARAVAPWRDRLRHTMHLLSTMDARLSAPTPPTP